MTINANAFVPVWASVLLLTPEAEIFVELPFQATGELSLQSSKLPFCRILTVPQLDTAPHSRATNKIAVRKK